MDPQQVQAAFGQLQAEVQQLRQQQLHAQQNAAPVAAVAPAAPAPRAFQPRLAPPPSYSGSSTPAVLDAWLREIRKHCRYYGPMTDEQAVNYGSAQLSGYALDWWDALTAESRAQAAASFATFEQVLRARFQPVTSSDTARLQLDSLRQGPKQSIHDYISSFRRYVAALPAMHEGDKVHAFLRGLHASVQRDLRKDGVATVEDAIIKAARIGAMDQFSARSAAAAAGHGYAQSSSSSSMMDLNNIEGLEQQTGESDDGAAGADSPVTRAELRQFLAAMQQQRGGRSGRHAPPSRGGRSAPRVPGLSEQEVRKRLDTGACFQCGEAGHRKYDCPQNKKQGF